MFFIDSHCHLTDERYSSVGAVYSACMDSGVRLLVDVGWDEKSTVGAAAHAAEFENIYFTAGLHPSESLRVFGDKLPQAIEAEKIFLTDKKCIAVGEIGLDYHYDGTDKLKQKELFEAQIYLADSYSLPIAIHSRDASKDMLDILTANKSHFKSGLLMHCYSESREQAKAYLDLGAYFAFGGVITFKNSKKDDIIRAIPLDRLLCETDSPYMTPEPFRGKLNSPENVILVYRKLAAVIGIDEENLCDILKTNFLRLFKKVCL